MAAAALAALLAGTFAHLYSDSCHLGVVGNYSDYWTVAYPTSGSGGNG